jgi:hypothetical protein
MYNDPDIEQFFREFKEKISTPSPPGKSRPSASPPMQIKVLAESNGDIVARFVVEGRIAGEFYQISNGEVWFYYSTDKARRWYVNKDLSTFHDAAGVFNKCGQLACESPEKFDDDPDGMWIQDYFRSKIETIERLGDPATSLWSATAHETDGGLLNLY